MVHAVHPRHHHWHQGVQGTQGFCSVYGVNMSNATEAERSLLAKFRAAYSGGDLRDAKAFAEACAECDLAPFVSSAGHWIGTDGDPYGTHVSLRADGSANVVSWGHMAEHHLIHWLIPLL